MNALDLYGAGAFSLICLIFVAIRKIPYYVFFCLAVVSVFCWLTRGLISPQTGEWIVMTSGLLLFSFGLLIVRVMLLRSVSLQLLRSIETKAMSAKVSEDISGRLADMDYFRLIQRGDRNRLTSFGRFCSAVVVIFYATFRIK